jgi:hypothetical protein
VPRFRRKTKGDLAGSETVDLSESEHAWWATSRVQHAYGMGTDTSPAPAATPAPEPAVFEPWTYDDVFAPTAGGADSGCADDTTAPCDSRDLAEVFVEESSYRALGLEVGATWDEVVLAHRTIAKRFHPDRLIHADDATRTEGEEQMRSANAAYEQLQKQHRRQRPAAPLFGS